jgi:hypothetical protein
VGKGIAEYSPDPSLAVRYWKNRDGFHPDLLKPVNLQIAPGQVIALDGPISIHFPYATNGKTSDWLQRLEAVQQAVKPFLAVEVTH